MHLYTFSALKFKLGYRYIGTLSNEPVHERNALARFVP